MFIKDIATLSEKVYDVMSRTRSYTYPELQKLTDVDDTMLRDAIIKLLQENRITQTRKGDIMHYAVR